MINPSSTLLRQAYFPSKSSERLVSDCHTAFVSNEPASVRTAVRWDYNIPFFAQLTSSHDDQCAVWDDGGLSGTIMYNHHVWKQTDIPARQT